MSRRNWNPVAHFSSPGLVFGAFGFTSTLIGTNPSTALMFGCGGLTSAAASAGVANSGPSFVSSIVKTANNGEFLITFADGWRAVWYVEGHILGSTAGPADGRRIQCCVPANQGSGHTTAVTMLATILGTNNVPLELDARVLNFFCVFKDSGVGT